MRIFGRKFFKGNKAFKILEQRVESFEKAQKTIDIRDYLYDNLTAGSILEDDPNKANYIKEGYESNPPTFAVLSRMGSMFSNIKMTPHILKGKEWEQTDKDPIADYFMANPADYTLREFKNQWYMFNLALGESIVFYEANTFGGNNAGKIFVLEHLPPQNVDIRASGDDPVGSYVVKQISTKDRGVDPENIWHTRLYPNLDYSNGKNFRGISPMGVAVKRIIALNEGENILKNIYKRPVPIGLLGREDLSADQSEEAMEAMQDAYQKKYGNTSHSGLPIVTAGKYYWLPLSTTNLRDMQILDANKDGIAVLCAVWGISHELFGLGSTTFANKRNALKSAYEDKIIPDYEVFLEGLNKIIFPMTGIMYKSDASHISVLQDDKLELARLGDIGVRNGSWTRNEFREITGLEPIDDDLLGEQGLIDNAVVMPSIEQAGKKLEGLEPYE